jgi:hypothetical protein
MGRLCCLCAIGIHVTLSFYETPYHEDAYLMSVLGGGEWSASRSGRLIPKDTVSGVYGIGSLLDSKTGLSTVGKCPAPAGNRTPGPSVMKPIA